MRRPRARHRSALNAEINIVSLIDVMMLLMIIFMITAPLLTGGVDVKLPKASVKAVQSSDGIDVTIRRDGSVVIDDQQIAQEGLPAALTTLTARAAGRTIFLRGDDGAEYGKVVQVLALLREAGLQNVSLVAEQQSAR